MKDYCKITENHDAMDMFNPYKATWRNPTEEQKAMIAEVDGWLEKVYTEQPEYDPDTQWVEDKWYEQGGKAVQTWIIHDIDPEK